VNEKDEARQQAERSIWERLAQNYDHTVMRSFEQAYALTVDMINEKLTPQSRVLEVGCGTGIIALDIAPKVEEVVGVDISPAMVDVAKSKAGSLTLNNVRFEVGDGYDLPFEAGSFDQVLLTNLLHVVQNPDAILREAKRLLKPDGLLITVTDCYAEKVPFFVRLKLMAQRLMKILGMVKYMHYYTTSDLDRLLDQHGFEIERQAILHSAPVNYYLSGKKV
jgi:ubiquinone/menaquinone biosynthesis C-methylase UbiE